jgi:hypothetical protein
VPLEELPELVNTESSDCGFVAGSTMMLGLELVLEGGVVDVSSVVVTPVVTPGGTDLAPERTVEEGPEREVVAVTSNLDTGDVPAWAPEAVDDELAPSVAVELAGNVLEGPYIGDVRRLDIGVEMGKFEGTEVCVPQKTVVDIEKKVDVKNDRPLVGVRIA